MSIILCKIFTIFLILFFYFIAISINLLLLLLKIIIIEFIMHNIKFILILNNFNSI